MLSVKLPLLGIFHGLMQPFVKDVLGYYWLYDFLVVLHDWLESRESRECIDVL